MTLMSRIPIKIEAADQAARHWQFSEPGPLRVGSKQHKQAACRMFHETFNPYKPSVIDWPTLDQTALARLTGLPIWDIAVQTEGKARLRMSAPLQQALPIRPGERRSSTMHGRRGGTGYCRTS
jgi:hypothetical protein